MKEVADVFSESQQNCNCALLNIHGSDVVLNASALGCVNTSSLNAKQDLMIRSAGG